MSRATVTVTQYKWNGKWYGSLTSTLTEGHEVLADASLGMLFFQNHESTWHYSSVRGGTSSKDMYHIIEVDYPDDRAGFCRYLIDRTTSRCCAAMRRDNYGGCVNCGDIDRTL